MEKLYWKTDRTTDTKLNKLQIGLEVEDIKYDHNEYGDSIEEEKDESDCLFRLFSNLFYFVVLRILQSFKFFPSAFCKKDDII